MDAERPPTTAEFNPITRAAYRRQLWREILLPTVLGVLVLGAVAWFLWRSNVASLSAWADASLIILLAPVLIVALLPLAFVAVLIFGVSRLIGVLPHAAYRLQEAVERAGYSARRAAKLAVEPMVMAESSRAAIMQGVRGLVSIFRSGR